VIAFLKEAMQRRQRRALVQELEAMLSMREWVDIRERQLVKAIQQHDVNVLVATIGARNRQVRGY